MGKLTALIILITLLASCSSLEKKSTQLNVGASRSDVAKIMGPAPYKFTHENVDAWRYAVVAGFGYCDYREFYIYGDILILKNEYHRASIAGCTVGLKGIDWNTILTVAGEYDSQNPTLESQRADNIVEQITELNKLRENGVITENEFTKAKQSLLSK